MQLLCGYKHVRLTLEEFINAVGLVKRIAPKAILNDDFKIAFAYYRRIKFDHEKKSITSPRDPKTFQWE